MSTSKNDTEKESVGGEEDGGAIGELRSERDLYLRLLRLGEKAELEPLLDEALGLIVDLVGARSGYLELLDPESGEAAWTLTKAHASESREDLLSTISRTIIADALASDKTTSIESAITDERYASRESVMIGRIDAVLCVPIGSDPAIGILYLQGRFEPGPFRKKDVERAEVFGRHFAPFADRLISRALTREHQDATEGVRKQLHAEGVIGRSQALATVLRQASQVAPLNVHVLLTGDSGTGKSQLANIIHANGPRSNGPFIEVNCAAIPESLFENELFGHVSGAYTGAKGAANGKIAAADRGTLFLDEIGEVPLHLQAKLLQFLQNRSYFPVGGSETITADVRVIAATNLNLEEAVANKTFREDLFYRLQVLPIRVPSLVERRDDIAELAAFFCIETCQRHGFAELELSRSSICRLETNEWPGNVRQLGHAIEAAVIRAVSENTAQVDPRHLFPAEYCDDEETDWPSLANATRRFQGDFLRRTLERADWNIAEAARQLDVARSHAYNLIKVHGLKRGEKTSSDTNL